MTPLPFPLVQPRPRVTTPERATPTRQVLDYRPSAQPCRRDPEGHPVWPAKRGGER